MTTAYWNRIAAEQVFEKSKSGSGEIGLLSLVGAVLAPGPYYYPDRHRSKIAFYLMNSWVLIRHWHMLLLHFRWLQHNSSFKFNRGSQEAPSRACIRLWSPNERIVYMSDMSHSQFHIEISQIYRTARCSVRSRDALSTHMVQRLSYCGSILK